MILNPVLYSAFRAPEDPQGSGTCLWEHTIHLSAGVIDILCLSTLHNSLLWSPRSVSWLPSSETTAVSITSMCITRIHIWTSMIICLYKTGFPRFLKNIQRYKVQRSCRWSYGLCFIFLPVWMWTRYQITFIRVSEKSYHVGSNMHLKIKKLWLLSEISPNNGLQMSSSVCLSSQSIRLYLKGTFRWDWEPSKHTINREE